MRGSDFLHVPHWSFYPNVIESGFFESTGIFFAGYHVFSETVNDYLYSSLANV